MVLRVVAGLVLAPSVLLQGLVKWELEGELEWELERELERELEWELEWELEYSPSVLLQGELVWVLVLV